MGEDRFRGPAAGHQRALLGRGVAVVARHEQALAELDRAAQRPSGGERGQRVAHLVDAQELPAVGRRPVDPAQLAADLGSGIACPTTVDDTSARPAGAALSGITTVLAMGPPVPSRCSRAASAGGSVAAWW